MKKKMQKLGNQKTIPAQLKWALKKEELERKIRKNNLING